MGQSAHVTTQITPKAPGDNQISVVVVMTKEETSVKRVEVSLINRDGKNCPFESSYRTCSVGVLRFG